MVEERSPGARIANSLIYIVVGLLAIMAILPFWNVLSISLSSRAAVEANVVSLWPVGLHFENYQHVLNRPQFTRSLLISVARVVFGVGLQLLVCMLTAYPLARETIDMPGRTLYKMFLIFGMLFSGGLIPYFLLLRDIRLLNTFAVLVVPTSLSIFHSILILNFFRGIPRELAEAAEIDGATHFDVLFRVYLPLSTPALMTVGLFAAVQHWNAWFDGLVFIRDAANRPLQSLLYSIVMQGGADAEAVWGTIGQVSNLTPRGLSGAMLLFAALPILIIYPYIQRYFTTGLTLGAIKQ